MKNAITLLGWALMMIPTASFAQSHSIHITNSFPVSGSGKWDYLAINPVNHQLYLAHGTQVNIIDPNTGDSTGIITNVDGVHGIAFAEKAGRGFTSNGKKNTVAVFDIKSNQITTEIKTGENPDAIMFEPFSQKIFVGNGISKTFSVIDPLKDTVIKTIELGGKPEAAVSDGKGLVFVNIEDRNEIAVVDVRTYSVLHHWQVGKGEEPAGLAVDLKNKRLFAGCGNSLLVVLDITNGKVIAELSIGEGSDGIAFDPVTKYVFSSNGSGSLSVIRQVSADTYESQTPLNTPKGAKTLCLDTQNHLIYTSASDFERKDPESPMVIIPGTFRAIKIDAK